MDHTIIEVIDNTNNNYMIRVVLDENNTIFLNFDHIPSQEEVNSVVENYKSVSNNIPAENNNDQTGL